MANGFIVKEKIAATPAAVWAYFTDFGHATEWMTGIEDMTPAAEGPLEIGTRLRFKSRGKERDCRVTALDQGNRIALTSTQGGVTATYTYVLGPDGDGAEMTLRAECEATGLWRLIHPMIVLAMKKSDSSQLANLKATMERG